MSSLSRRMERPIFTRLSCPRAINRRTVLLDMRSVFAASARVSNCAVVEGATEALFLADRSCGGAAMPGCVGSGPSLRRGSKAQAGISLPRASALVLDLRRSAAQTSARPSTGLLTRPLHSSTSDLSWQDESSLMPRFHAATFFRQSQNQHFLP